MGVLFYKRDSCRLDSAQLRDVVQQTQVTTGAVIKFVKDQVSSGQHYTQQKARKEFYFQIQGSATQVERAKEELERFFKNVSTPSSIISILQTRMIIYPLMWRT